MKYYMRATILLMAVLLLTNCAIVPGAVVGAAFSPVVQPVVDRGLVMLHADWVDPAGTQAVKDYDTNKANAADTPSK
jgi:hypothetical protein